MLVDRYGVVEVARRAGVGKEVVARTLAGLGVRRGSLALIAALVATEQRPLPSDARC